MPQSLLPKTLSALPDQMLPLPMLALLPNHIVSLALQKSFVSRQSGSDAGDHFNKYFGT